MSTYIPKQDRKKILLLSDDIRSMSGVATMSREIVTGTADHFSWFNIGGSLMDPPQPGTIYDISSDVNQRIGITDSDVRILPNKGYGSPDLLRQILKIEKPDAIFIFTDPRYWIWLFEVEREIRSKIPIIYLNIWDSLPYPLWNKEYYNSVDALFAISKQTKIINEVVLGKDAASKVIKYIPHGINHNTFFPVDRESEELKTFRSSLFKGKEIEYTVFFNSRNMHRKHPADLVLAYRMFCDRLTPAAAGKCALVLHTHANDPNGTDLNAVVEAFCDPEIHNVYFSEQALPEQSLNLLYNIADVTVLPSSNEGWGLSITESLMAGTVIIANVTGGMQDQMRFEDNNGNWYEPTPDLPSNHRKTYTKHGIWVDPVYPTNLSVAGSPTTPYIFDDRCSPEDLADALYRTYRRGPQERDRRGLQGREWLMSQESKMSAQSMCQNIVEGIEETFEKFIPRPSFDIIKVSKREKKQIKQKLYE